MTTEAIELPVGPLRFDARVTGPADGSPVLLLHGFPESSHAWRGVQPILADAGYRSVAPDLRGYSPGARPVGEEHYTMAILRGDVIGLADALGWDRFHLVGHDWGGALAWQVAAHHPDRLRSLSVVSTPHPAAFTRAKSAGPSVDGDDQAARSGYMTTFRDPAAPDLFVADDRALLRLLLEGSGLDESSAAHYLDRFRTREEVDGALSWYRGADPADADDLGPVTTPTLYVWSTDDIALGRTAAELTVEHVEGPYRFEVLEGVSHWVVEEATEALTALLVSHLDLHR